MSKSWFTILAWGCAAALPVSILGTADRASAETRTASSEEVVDLTTWDYGALTKGWGAEELLDTTVRGADGEEMGEVENILVNAEGNVEKIIVEAQGFLDIGDTHFSVPWDQVEIGPDMEYVIVPINEDNLEDFNLFDDSEVSAGPRSWRVTELIDDYVTLEADLDYGYVEDLIFDQEGKLQSVVIVPAVAFGTPGYYAYPYYGYDYGYDPGSDIYALPYTRDQITGLEPFDYDAFTG